MVVEGVEISGVFVVVMVVEGAEISGVFVVVMDVSAGVVSRTGGSVVEADEIEFDGRGAVIAMCEATERYASSQVLAEINATETRFGGAMLNKSLMKMVLELTRKVTEPQSASEITIFPSSYDFSIGPLRVSADAAQIISNKGRNDCCIARDGMGLWIIIIII